MSDMPFNVRLRQATKEVHTLSDALVNAKFAFALSNNAVWAEGLLVFYEIFKYLEEAMQRHPTQPLGRLHVDGMDRTAAFEKDLAHFLGSSWRIHYRPRKAVRAYLRHLDELENSNPNLLIAYVYHLYMGILSGGQILKKKRAVLNRLFGGGPSSQRGNNVVDFVDISVSDLKSNLVEKINCIAKNFDEDLKNRLIDESRTVYELNNEIIKSVEGASVIFYKKLIKFVVIALILISFLTFVRRIF